MLDIKIAINKGRLVESIYVSPREDVDVEIIDFYTGIPDEFDYVYKALNKLQNENKWKCVY